ncbi:MAG: cation-translocating P-type ATPase, partial [Myxococcota bacterium]
MAARSVLVRRLPAVETLGATTVICTDKTGTLTTGAMAVREVWGPDHDAVLRAAASCCDAEPPVGDPTEVALVLGARVRGFDRAAIERENPRIAVHPFDSVRKRMSIRRADGVLYVKGAVDLMLPLCVAGAERAVEANAEMAARGLRVLAVAVGRGDAEEGLTLLGLVGIADPPRTEAIAAVADARTAGIKTVMITGDHPVTARAIAREIGIVAVDEDPDGRVHARVTPEDKLEVVRSWKKRGEVVAMTGDGVNDAPALREAHIGIAMGRAGTEVTREAADMVLADDNFASIVAAVREGRAIYDNIRKTLVYLLAGNTSELLLMLGAAIAGLPAPLIPLQLLWINLVTDGLPALALVVDPPDADVLRRPPRAPDAPMLGRREWLQVAFTGLVEATVVFTVFLAALPDLERARSTAFSTLVFGELFRAFAARSPDKVLWQVGAFSNLRLLGVVALSALFQVAISHVPVIAMLFGVRPLTATELAMCLGLGLLPVTVLELRKLLWRSA